jgi:sortase A
MPFSFKRHLLPPLLGIGSMLLVMGALNAEYIWTQTRYRFADHHADNISLVANTTPANPAAPAPKPDPSAPSSITIPAIDVKAPVVFDETSTEEWKVQLALRRGVVHYSQTGVPGKPGNVVLIGHSSGQPWAPGDYKWVFTLLDKLKKDDQIKVSYQGIDYIYRVTGSVVVTPDNLTVLDQTTNNVLSLVTCTPVGTSKSRLVVHAEQISPTPEKTKASGVAKPLKIKPEYKTELPGNSDHSTSVWKAVGGWFKNTF